MTAATVREMSDAMVTSGMRDAGYIYICLDDEREIPGHRLPTGNSQSGEIEPQRTQRAQRRFGI